MILLLICACSGEPSDRAIEDQFRSHRQQFDEVVGRIQRDPGIVYSGPFLAELKGLGVTGVITSGVSPGMSIQFTLATSGYSVHGSAKGLVYSPIAVHPEFDSLDGHEVTPPDSEGYRRIDTNWHVWLHRF